jgi:hypothetical protein
MIPMDFKVASTTRVRLHGQCYPTCPCHRSLTIFQISKNFALFHQVATVLSVPNFICLDPDF